MNGIYLYFNSLGTHGTTIARHINPNSFKLAKSWSRPVVRWPNSRGQCTVPNGATPSLPKGLRRQYSPCFGISAMATFGVHRSISKGLYAVRSRQSR